MHRYTPFVVVSQFLDILGFFASDFFFFFSVLKISVKISSSSEVLSSVFYSTNKSIKGVILLSFGVFYL